MTELADELDKYLDLLTNEAKAAESSLEDLFDLLGKSETEQKAGFAKVNQHLTGVHEAINSAFAAMGITEEELLEMQQPKPQPQEDEGISLSPEEILATATIDGKMLRLNTGKLNRDSYKVADRLLRCLGGTWKGGKTQAHVFKEDPTEVLENYLQKGELPDLNPLAFFQTKPPVAKQMASWIRPENADIVLDADAGLGVLGAAVKKRFPHTDLHLVEIDPERANALRDLNIGTVFESDFLDYQPDRLYKAIVMNPPFSIKEKKWVYAIHILAAWELLAPGGQLAAIAPLSFTFCKDSLNQSIKDLAENHGSVEELPPNSFEGTGASAAILYLTKPEKKKASLPCYADLPLFSDWVD
jgi:hypothetical protein